MSTDVDWDDKAIMRHPKSQGIGYSWGMEGILVETGHLMEVLRWVAKFYFLTWVVIIQAFAFINPYNYLYGFLYLYFIYEMFLFFLSWGVGEEA